MMIEKPFFGLCEVAKRVMIPEIIVLRRATGETKMTVVGMIRAGGV